MENRIIKFRLIFDDKVVGYMQFKNQGLKANLNWMYSTYQKTWHFEPKNAHTHVDQFTGLLDKNGKEIYEGDIVKMPELCLVVYKDAGFILESISLKTEWNTDYHLKEVIGNVFETPELLNH